MSSPRADYLPEPLTPLPPHTPPGALAVDLSRLLDDRLILVTGKGGTGKTTVASAIAAVLASAGHRTILCEVDAQQPALTPIFGIEPGFAPTRASAHLDVCNLVWPESLAAYLQRMIPMGRIVRAILANDMVRRFLDFVPGSQELVTVSVIADLLERYDRVVVDLPASGHAFSMLDITRSALGLFRAGPVRSRVLELRKVLEDPRTRTVLVALPEEMVVNETLETLGRLRDADLLGGEPLIVLNRARDPDMTEHERTLLDRLSEAAPGGDAAEFLEAGRWERATEDAVDASIARLTQATGAPPVVVPPEGAGGKARSVVTALAGRFASRMKVALSEPSWI